MAPPAQVYHLSGWRENERAWLEHVRQRAKAGFRSRQDLGKDHMADLAHELPELAIGHRREAGPRTVKADGGRLLQKLVQPPNVPSEIQIG